MRDNNLKRWLISNNCLLDKNSDLKPTHFFLDGGKANIGFDKLDEFHSVYTNCINNNIQLFVIECKTPIFRLFADLDFASCELIDNDSIIDIITKIHSAICYLYSSDLNVIVCSTTNKKINKNGNALIKQGFHLFWPEVYVNTGLAIKIRQYVLHKIKLIYGEREVTNTWSEVIDEVVYKANGIRMNGSYKINITNTDDNKKRFQTENRKYTLLTVINSSGQVVYDAIQRLTDINELIKNTSIRTDKIEPTKIQITEPLEINEIITIDNQESQVDKDDDEFYLKRINRNNRKYDEILKFFDIHVSGKYYKTSDIKSILYIEKTDSYVLKTNSKYCQNIERDHNSCGVYFFLSKNGFCQKCYCKCNTTVGRNNGLCKNYSSPIISCSLHILRALNWEVKKKNPKKVIEDDQIPFSLGKKNISYKSKVALLRTNIYNGITGS